jgi:hypothetical protein
MTQRILGPVLAITAMVGGCAAPDDVSSNNELVAVVDDYEQTYSWSDPSQCEVYLHQRVTDQSARIVEYLARVGGDELSILYAMDETAELPMRIEVVHARGGDGLAIAFDSDRMVVGDGDGNTIVSVTDYAAGEGNSAIDVGGATASPELVSLLRCALPVRRELGAVAPFLTNKEQPGRLPDAPDISQGSEDASPIIDWTADVTIPGSLVLAAACVQTDGWACPCLAWNDQLTGLVSGWC